MAEVVLLPSARLIPPELQTEFGRIPPAMIPLDNRPVLHYVAEQYLDIARPVVLVHERAELVEEYLAQHPGLCGSAVNVGPTPHIAGTVLQGLRRLGQVPTGLIINFADTLVRDPLVGRDVACWVEPGDDFRWTMFESTPEGRIGRVVDKDCPKPAGVDRAFVGVFRFSDVPRLIESLVSAIDEGGEVDPFWTAIRSYFNARLPGAAELQAVGDWRDFGHLDTYFATKRQFARTTRYFNDLNVDARRGVVRKRSRDVARLRNETRWYATLPSHLQYVAPRVFGCDMSATEPWVDLEFYGYPSLSDLYLYADLNLGVWQRILQAIGHVLDDLHATLEPSGVRADYRLALSEMYDLKTRARLAPILQDPRFAQFCEPQVRINGDACAGLPTVLDQLPALLAAAGLDDAESFSVIHGDFCLGNILYDRRHGLVRLVDPRGGFGNYAVHGDPRYDVAKLCHSFRGDYDFLVNGLFSASTSSDWYEFRPFTQTRHVAVKRLFDEWVSHRWPAQIPALRVLESLLFLSMVPLHADRFECQRAFLAQGLWQLSKLTGVRLPAPSGLR